MLLTTNAITRLAVRQFKNTNAFLRNVDTQYSDEFAREGAKIGDTLRIRLPNQYTVTDGPALSAQQTNETATTLTVGYQRHVDTTFSTAQLSLSLQDFSERIAAPMMNYLAGNVAAQLMTGIEGGCSNFVAAFDGGGAIISPNAQTFLEADAKLSDIGAKEEGRNLVLSPTTMARSTATLSGLFNPAAEISRQYRKGAVQQALNFNWFKDQTTLVHTTGSFTAGTVFGADQSGLTLVTNAITGTFNKGDIITIAGVFAVNRTTYQNSGTLQQFVVTADVITGATSIPIYPAIVAPATTGPAAGQPVQYQTVNAAPANGAALALVNTAGERYRKNFGYAFDFVTLATADLPLPSGNGDAARAVYDGISMRMVKNWYNVQTDQMVSRLDILFGYTYVRPEWGVIVGDAL